MSDYKKTLDIISEKQLYFKIYRISFENVYKTELIYEEVTNYRNIRNVLKKIIFEDNIQYSISKIDEAPFYDGKIVGGRITHKYQKIYNNYESSIFKNFEKFQLEVYAPEITPIHRVFVNLLFYSLNCNFGYFNNINMIAIIATGNIIKIHVDIDCDMKDNRYKNFLKHMRQLFFINKDEIILLYKTFSDLNKIKK